MGETKTTSGKNTFDMIDPSDALQILKTLSQESSGIRKRIEEIFLNQVSEVDVSEISNEVFSDLDFLDIGRALG